MELFSTVGFESKIRTFLSYGVMLRLDCASMPFLTPDENVLIGMQGCDYGFSSLAVKSDGTVTPCSFLDERLGFYRDLRRIWMEMDREMEAEECKSCEIYWICRGGCRVFFEGQGSRVHQNSHSTILL